MFLVFFLGAKIFHDKGFAVKVNQTSIAPSAEEWKDYADNGDIEITARVEIKRCNKDFTCAEDFPFKDAMICNKNAFDRAHPKPVYIMIINKAGTHYKILHCDTRNEWFVKEKGDGRYGSAYSQKVYMCDKNLFKFIKI